MSSREPVHRLVPARAFAVLALAMLAGCSSKSSTRLASVEIDASGGTIAVDSGILAGTMLVVPAGAVVDPVTVSIDMTGVTAVPDASAIGPAAAFSPDGTTFATPATLTLALTPVMAAQLPPEGAAPAGIVIKQRQRDGRIIDIVPTAVDQTAGTVTAEVSTLASFWVARQVSGGDIAMFDYWPMAAGDRWEFVDNFAVTVTESNSEPNLPTLVTRLSLVGSGIDEGFYFERVGGETDVFGRYGRYATTEQDLYDQGLVLLPATMRLGDQVVSMDGYDGYTPIGTTMSTFRGDETITVRLLTEGRYQTSLGQFNDVLEVEIEGDRVDDRPDSSTSVFHLWLARDIGPIQLDSPLLPAPTDLRQALVGGLVIP